MENNNALPPATGRKHSTYETIAAFLERTNTALTNAQLPAISPLLKLRGYEEGVIGQKLEENAALRTLNEQQFKEYGEQYQATSDYAAAHEAVHEIYMDHLKLARIVFKNEPAAKTALGLRGDRASSQSGYASQGLLFYNNALNSADFRDGLAKKGITVEELNEGVARFENLQSLTAGQKKETGEAQEATKKRDRAYDSLSDWMSDFYGTAKVALRKHPQLMEQLEIKEV